MASSNNPQNTGGGTTISFGNTPQAKDDNLLSAQTGITEDTKAVFILDVMANDLGGNAKALWSVDNGVNNSGAMSGKIEGDLLTEDTARTAALSTDTSLNGARIWITSDGKVGYDTTSLTSTFAAQLQALPVGQTLTDSFTYAIRLAAGTLSWAKATVEFKGVNDAPVITSTAAAALGSVKEDTTLSASGQLSASDVDAGATQAWSVVGAAVGTYGSIAVNSANGAWTYTLNNGTNGVASIVQSLAAGESKTESFTLQVSDGLGGVAAQVVTLTITGTNDAPVITSTATAAQGATKEDTVVSASGQLTASDIDNGATQAWSVVGSGTGTYGSIAVNAATGQWTYSLANGTNGVASAVQSLAVGETKTESFTIQVSDGQGGTAAQVVTLTITGTNDAPVITNTAAAAQGAVQEDAAQQVASGQLTASDIDTGATQAWSVSGSNSGTYGSIAVDGNTGAWTYTLNNGTNGVSSIVQNLAAGQSVTDSFTVVVDDSKGGTATQVVTVTITGNNDAPVITSTVAAAQGAVQEDGAKVATGQLSASDIDTGATQAWSVSGSNTGSYGSIAVDGNTGAWTYTLNNGTNGVSSIVQNLAAGQSVTDSFTVVVDDTKGGTATQVVTVTITGNNDAPVITSTVADAAGSVTEDVATTVSGQLAASDIDNGATKTWSVLTPAATSYGSLAIDASGKWTYSLNNGVDGVASVVQSLAAGQQVTEQFTVRVDDGKGGTADQVVNVTLTGINDPAVIGKSGASMLEGNGIQTTTGLLTASDIDSPNTFQAQTLTGTYGNLTLQSNGTWSYTMNSPHNEFVGGQNYVDVFSATTADGTTRADAITVTITGTNDPAVISSQSKNLVETNAPLSTSGQLTVTDVDSSPTLVAQNNVAGAYGNFSIAADGSWTYAMNGPHDEFAPNQNYTDSFSVTSADGTVKANAVTVTITGTPDGPTGVNDSNTLAASTITANTSNVVYWTDWQSAQLVGGSVSSNGTTDYNVKVSGTITLNNGHQIGVTYEGLAWLVLLGQNQPAPGLLNYNSFEWTEPNPNDRPYTSAQVNSGPTTWDIIGLNEAFTGGGYQTGSRTDFSPRNLTFSEPVDNLFFAVVSMNNNGYSFDQNFQIVSQGPGKYGDSPDISPTNLGNGQYGIVSGGEFNAVLKIGGSVDHLTWTSQNRETWNGFTVGTYGQAKSATATGNVLANDVKGMAGDTLSVSVVGGQNMTGNSVTLTLASGATIKIDKDGDYFYDDKGVFASLGAGQNHVESIGYTVKDNYGLTSTATLSIQVNGVNDAPVAVADSASVNEDGSVTINVLTNDTDVDAGDSKSLLSVGSAAHGTVSMSGNAVVYTPASNYNGADSFSYIMKDAAGLTSTASVSVTVNPVDDAPTVSFAAPLVITNGAFAGNANGWTTLNGGVDVVENGGWNSSEGTPGTYSVDLNAFTKGGLKQTLSTVPGVTYSINFMFSKNPGETGTAIVQVGATGNPSVDYAYSAANSAGNMQWTQKTYTFVATGTNTDLSFTSLTPATSLGFPGDAQGPALDNVTVGADIGAFEDAISVIKGITVADIDATGSIQLTLSVAHGTLALTSTAGLSGDTNGSDGILSFTGTQAAINAALAGGVNYKGKLDFNGADVLTATVNDLGQTGIGGPLSQTKTQSIYVAPVGEVISVPGSIVANGSFESTTANVFVSVGDLSGNWTVANSWTMTGNGVDFVSNGQGAEGSNWVDLNAYDPGGVKQTLSTSNGTTYNVSFMESKNPGATTTQIARVAAAGSQQDYSYSTSNSETSMQWVQHTFSFTATGASTDLNISSLTPSNWQFGTNAGFPVDAEGPALDDVVVVANTIYNGFLKGAYGDVLSLSSLLSSIGSPHNATAFSSGFLRFQTSGADTLVQIDANGGGDNYITAATLVGVLLTQADSVNYVL